MNQLVVVGGSDGGISAVLRAKELDASTQVMLIVEDTFLNYSICGLPFYMGMSRDASFWTYSRLSQRETKIMREVSICL